LPGEATGCSKSPKERAGQAEPVFADFLVPGATPAETISYREARITTSERRALMSQRKALRLLAALFNSGLSLWTLLTNEWQDAGVRIDDNGLL
jgi:hypothetical protein